MSPPRRVKPRWAARAGARAGGVCQNITDSTHSGSKTPNDPIFCRRGRIIALRSPFERVCLIVLGTALVALSSPASAETKLEARYTAALAGIPLGTGTWVIDFTADQYTAIATGHTTGLIKLISDGSG